MKNKLIQLTQTDESGAKIITLKNVLREKIGSGGLDKIIIERAEDHIRNNDISFQWPASELLKKTVTAIETAQSKAERNRPVIEIICKPVMQLKASGGMFGYPLLTRISNIVLNFLDDRETLDDEAFGILEVYIRMIRSVIEGQVTGDGGNAGSALIREMEDACARYNRKSAAPKN